MLRSFFLFTARLQCSDGFAIMVSDIIKPSE